MQIDRQHERGHNLSAGATGDARQSFDGVLLFRDTDATGVELFCCGTGVPVIDPEDVSAHYSACPIFQETVEQRWRADRPLFITEDPEPYEVNDAGEYVDPFESDVDFGGLDPDEALDPETGFQLLRA